MKPCTLFTLLPEATAASFRICAVGLKLLSQPIQPWWAASM